MKKCFKKGVYKGFYTFVCAVLLFGGTFLLNEVRVHASNRTLVADYSAGQKYSVSEKEFANISFNTMTPAQEAVVATELAASFYDVEGMNCSKQGSNCDIFFSANPYQAVREEVSFGKTYFCANSSAVGTAKFVISKEVVAKKDIERDYGKNSSMSDIARRRYEREAVSFIKSIERDLEGEEGTGDSVYTVIIKFSTAPVIVDNARIGQDTVIYFDQGAAVSYNGLNYKVLDAAGNLGFTGVVKASKTVTVPDAVPVAGYNLGVTEVCKDALKGNKKVQTVSLGSNVRSVRKNAFKNCKKLKKVTFKAKKLSKIEKGSFGKNDKTLVVKVPKKEVKHCKSLLKKSSLSWVNVK